MGNNNEASIKNPKGFYMKLEWYDLFATMKPKQFQKLMLNSYNYLLGHELIDMNQSESQVFVFIIKPVLEHNIKVYQEKCEHNARISKKGVEAKAAKKLKEETDSTQNNPMGKITNPELPKDKYKEKDIVEDTVETIFEGKVEYGFQDESSKADNEFSILDRFKELVKIDSSRIEEKDDLRYLNNCKILAHDAGWFGFFILIIKSSIQELPELMKIHNSSLDLTSILEIRRHHIFYFHKLLDK